MLTSVAFPIEKPFWNKFSENDTSRSTRTQTVKHEELLGTSLLHNKSALHYLQKMSAVQVCSMNLKAQQP